MMGLFGLVFSYERFEVMADNTVVYYYCKDIAIRRGILYTSEQVVLNLTLGIITFVVDGVTMKFPLGGELR